MAKSNITPLELYTVSFFSVGDTITVSARHKVAASEYYSGLRGSREPNEVQATIIGVVKLLVSLSFSFIQILMVHGS
ncbi:hypothetical protein IGI04_023003 [Brassica rapa subsp. trilocularis]|uniref:Uncharacterized protein n=1 Tax=Brassica rapa subsp. trilocularis TaxID=1813537 RepID=A0ABQ7M570_BRACM|nr:hypothetical protein IGI04_023003 [Brassica rapa subsp. trilocularis]